MSGVAIATVISNIVSSSMVIYILTHESEPIKLELRQLKISVKELKENIGYRYSGRTSGNDVLNSQCVYTEHN